MPKRPVPVPAETRALAGAPPPPHHPRPPARSAGRCRPAVSTRRHAPRRHLLACCGRRLPAYGRRAPLQRPLVRACFSSATANEGKREAEDEGEASGEGPSSLNGSTLIWCVRVSLNLGATVDWIRFVGKKSRRELSRPGPLIYEPMWSGVFFFEKHVEWS